MSASDLMDKNKNFGRIKLKGGQTQGRTFIPGREKTNRLSNPDRHVGAGYARSYIEDDNRKFVESTQMLGAQGTSIPPELACLDGEGPSLISQMETLTSIGTIPNVAELNREELTQVYDNYSFEPPAVEMNLSVIHQKDKLLNSIMTNDILIIKGSTGCGKTTQIPQFILDACVEKRVHCNIIVTQPRKIAAISVAKRVCSERNWEVGTIVGYQVGLDKKASEDTRLLYCTTGVLLQKLISAKNMDTYTHVILDEIHERDMDMDFAMLVVRQFFRTNSRLVKVILMSATIDTSRFAEYFSLSINNQLVKAVVYDLGKVQNYPVHEFYLDDLEKIGSRNLITQMADNEPGIINNAYTLTVKLIESLDNLDIMENTLNNKRNDFKGSVLIFLPGIREIEIMHEKLTAIMTENQTKYKFWLCPLHSSITSDEQLKVFELPPPGVRKIILSTNIAESSITVSDIKYGNLKDIEGKSEKLKTKLNKNPRPKSSSPVIDFCLTKVLVYDESTNFSSLQLSWASKNSCEQRAGRAGRVMEGRVYRIVTRNFYKSLQQDTTPDMRRCPLTQVVLKTKMLGLGEPKAILALALDPPDLYKVQQNVLILKQIGALLLTSEGRLIHDDGDITFIGKIMDALPLDVHISKLIILGHLFGVLEEAIIMGCAMSVKSIFREPFKEQLQIYNSKLTWADSSCSDLIAFLNTYKTWRNLTTKGQFDRSRGTAEAWARRYYVELKGLRELSKLELEIKNRLKNFHIEQISGPNRVKWSEMEKPLILKIVIAGAFYPNYFTRSARAGQVDERDAVKTLDGRDPFTTVYLQNMPQPAELYVRQVSAALAPCSRQLKLSTGGYSKIFVEFPHSTNSETKDGNNQTLIGDIPGKIAMPVYRAVKLRHLKVPIVINTLKPEEAQKRALMMKSFKKMSFCGKDSTSSGSSASSSNEYRFNKTLPAVDQNFIDIKITHVEDAGHFWAQKSTYAEAQRLVYIQNLIQREGALVPITEEPKIGQILAAPFFEEGTMMYYRARIKSKISKDKFEVYFMDFGNTEILAISDLRDFENLSDEERAELHTEPDTAMECVLAEVQPSLIRNPKGKWLPESAKILQDLQNNLSNVLANVYSVVNGVVSLELFLNDNVAHGRKMTVNQRLIDQGYAQKSEESFLSKLNHDIRIHHSELAADQKEVYENQQADQSSSLDMNIQQPSASECRHSTNLKGPSSPLEMSIYSMTRASIGKRAIIDWASVNSVLLDADPQDPHERLLVSGTVGINPAGHQLNLRHTTMMPNIHGLSAILCMLFAPKIELRSNKKRTKLTGALCGLGVDTEGQSIFPPNDIEVTFDCEFTLADIEQINRVRFWMNQRVCSTPSLDIEDITPADIYYYQKKIAESLRDLLKTQRGSQEIYFNEDPYKWEQLKKSEMINPSKYEIEFSYINPIFDLHWGLELREGPDYEEIEELEQHLKQLAVYVQTGNSVKNVTCNLCQVEVKNSPLLRLHLQTTQHKELEAKLLKKVRQIRQNSSQ